MEHEALVHTAAMLACALLGLIAGNILDVSVSDYVIDAALGAMLYFVFVCIDGKAFKDAFLNIRFTSTAILVNFLWTPFFAFGLGYLFFSGDADIRIGLLLALAAPCTDWYLVFTAAAKGDMAVSSAILPLNLVLQIILTPLYLMLFFSSDVSMDDWSPVIIAVLTLVVPMVVAALVRISGRSRIVEKSQDNASTGQIIFLCMAVFVMFLNCSSSITDNWETVLKCVAPLLIFFVANTVLTISVSAALKWERSRSSSLMFTALARNSPLILAMMSPVFSDSPLVLAVLVICPLIELPYLSLASYLRGRKA